MKIPRALPVQSAEKSAQHRQNIAISVANARARQHLSPLVPLIQKSAWKTITAYAAHLGIGQATLSRYLNGTLNCPAGVDARVRRDFPKLRKLPAESIWGRGLLVHGAAARAADSAV